MASEDAFRAVAASLSAGRAVVFPTDTVYGIGVAVGLAPSPAEIYAVKRRDPEKAIPWLVGRPAAISFYGSDVPDYAKRLAEEFWPGPLTLIVKAAANVPAAFAAENGTLALRMPDDETALSLMERVGFPLATSSANLQGHTPPRKFSEVDPAVLSAVGASMGDDELRSGISSTIVDCTGESPVLVREGTVSRADIERALSCGAN